MFFKGLLYPANARFLRVILVKTQESAASFKMKNCITSKRPEIISIIQFLEWNSSRVALGVCQNQESWAIRSTSVRSTSA